MQLEPQQFYSAVEKSLGDGSFAPIYFFFGEEQFLVQQAVQYLRACAVDEASSDFNWRVFDADSADASKVKDEIETFPMMAARRVVLIREVADFKEAEWSILAPLIENPVSSTVVMMTTSKIDRRKKVMQKLVDSAVSVEFKKPYDNQIPGWIRHIAKGHGLAISDEALQFFHRLVGSQLTEIDGEIRKLKAYLGTREEILMEDVARCVSRLKEENVFKFVELLAKGDRVNSLMQAVGLLDRGQSDLGIVALAARHIRILLQIKLGEAQGLAGPKLAAHAQIPPYFLGDYQRQAQSWSLMKLENVMLILSETEKALKSSPLSSGIWIENMILKICELRQTSVESVRTQNTLRL